MTSPATRHRRGLPAAALALTLLAALALWNLLPGPAADPVALAAAFALLVGAELGALRLPGGGTSSAGAAPEMAALVVLGPAAGAWLSAGSILAVEGIARRRAGAGAWARAATAALSLWVAGAAFHGLGGRVGVLGTPRDLIPLLGSAAAYLLAHALLGALALGLETGLGPGRAAQRLARHGLPLVGASAALGCLGAAALLGAGLWTLPLLVAAALATRHAFAHVLEMRGDFHELVRALADVLDEVDPYTRQHSTRVRRYAVRLARALRCSEREVEDLEVAALVHDLGKIGPQHQRLLYKPGALSREEQRTVRSHPAAGAGIIGRVGALARAAEIVRLHHERPDGRGYPLGLGAGETPLGARILKVADAFDAMTSDRPYRPALDPEAAARELERGAGVEFDRGVVDCLRRLRAAGRFPLVPGPGAEEIRRLEVRGPRLRA
jgi:HD-GYP domain-containing protein (c-di-GMP phosphodiesterase class II)